MNKKYLKKFGFASLGGVAFAATTYCIYSTTEVADLTKEVDDLNNKIVARTIATNYQLGVKEGITKNLQEIILKPEKEQAKLDEELINKIAVNKTAAENQLRVKDGIINNLQEIIAKLKLKGDVYKPLYENIKKDFEDANKTLDELGGELTTLRADAVIKEALLKAIQQANEEFNKVNVGLKQKVKELEEKVKEIDNYELVKKVSDERIKQLTQQVWQTKCQEGTQVIMRHDIENFYGEQCKLNNGNTKIEFNSDVESIFNKDLSKLFKPE